MVLYVSGLLSGSFAFRIHSQNDPNGQYLEQIDGPFRPVLHDHVSALQKDFDRHHDLGGLSHAKTWGLASWGPYVASCITFHPGDVLEYNMVAEQRCQVIFTQEDTSSGLDEDAIFPWQGANPEVHQDTSSAVLQKVLALLATRHTSRDPAENRILYNVCSAALLCLDKVDWNLVEQILRRLAASTGISLDPEIRMLEDIRSSQVSVLVRMERLQEIAGARTEIESSSSPRDIYDSCSICDQIIIRRGLNVAYCAAGHQFGMQRNCSSPLSDQS